MGELLAFLSACCFASSNVTIIRGVKSSGGENGAFLSILLTVALGGGIFLVQSASRGWATLHASSMLWFAFAGIMTIFIGRVFSYASIQNLGAMRASAVKRLTPLFSVMVGVGFLGETLDLAMTVGTLLIIGSFAVLIRQSLHERAAVPRSVEQPRRTLSERLGGLAFVYGPVSSMAYAIGYVARKQGLVMMPDAAFGTMFGAITGALVFVVMAQFADSYRAAVKQTFTVFNPWLLLAGSLNSAGQVLYFMALSHSTISRVAMISSIEAILTIFITVAVTRSVRQVNGPVVLAAMLGVAGTVMIMVQ
jgi:drug/metabolite transporter (DMT)-like permease